MNILKNKFGKMPDSRWVDDFTLINDNGIQVKIINYGARVISVLAPDSDGNFENIVLGYDNLDDYLNDEFYLGAIVGRYANRIADGKFTLDDKEFTLTVNNGKNHLHGGAAGFDKVLWEAVQVIDDDGVGLKLSYISRDGEEGYPGRLNVDVVYMLSDDNELVIKYKAKANRATPVNLTQHCYFNLMGNHQTDILDHQLRINADAYLPVDENNIPTGKMESVSATPFDFTELMQVGKRISAEHTQIINGNGYDHNWVLNNSNGKIDFQAELFEPQSGRLIQIKTTEPGLQFYSGNFLNREETNRKFGFRSGLCLETQHFPDSPNQQSFPSTILSPSEIYQSRTVYKFLVK